MHLDTILRRAAALVLCMLALGAAPVAAQSWPQRSVKFILPLGPGSGADIAARLFGDRLSKHWGQPVVIENRPGADGLVAINAFISAADDHTLWFGPSSSFVAHPYLHDKMPYDPADLAPIARISNTLVSFSVPASLNVTSVADVMNLARAQPGKLNWTTITGVTDFIVEGFLKSAGIQMTRIPYRDTVQALNDLGEGRIQMYIAALAIVRPQLQAGRIKVLAITNREKAPDAPDIPTVAEAGYPGLSFDGLVGLFGPRSMPNELRDRIAADLRAVADDAEIRSRLTATGQLVRPGTAAELSAAIDEQAGKLAEFTKALGVKRAQ